METVKEFFRPVAQGFLDGLQLFWGLLSKPTKMIETLAEFLRR